MTTGGRGLQTERGWEKWIQSSDKFVFNERDRAWRKAISYIGRGLCSNAKHLYAIQSEKGLG